MTSTTPQDSRVANALSAKSSSIRLQAALAVGSGADADYTELLIERCAIEPDFFLGAHPSAVGDRSATAPSGALLRG